MKQQLGALSLFVGVVSVVIGYLSLAHDSQAWPYSGPAWVWIVLGSAVAAGGFSWIVVRRIRNAPLSVQAVSAGFTMAVIGAVTATAAAAGTAASTAGAVDGTIASAVSIDSIRDGQLIDDPITVGGTIPSPLASGESLWLFVGNIPPTGGPPSTYYLLPGPCEIREGGRSWACSNVALAHIGRRKIDFYVLSALGDQSRIFGQQLITGGRLDEHTRLVGKYHLTDPPPGPDPRTSNALPGGQNLRQHDSVSATLAR